MGNYVVKLFQVNQSAPMQEAQQKENKSYRKRKFVIEEFFPQFC